MKAHLMITTLTLIGLLAVPSLAAQQPATLPEEAAAMVIVVESVSGKVQYVRDGTFQQLTTASKLTHGDKLIVNVGAVCKLEFQHPTSGAVLSAVIVRGYADITMAEAYLEGEQSRTQLDISQGVIRAGVVKTAVPPSFRMRTPRVVVGVRGTEIAELEVSDDEGDILRMGRIGIAMTHDSIPYFRSTRAGQGTEKSTETDWRGGALLRAIENALLDSRIVLRGPHRRGLEVDFDRNSFDLVEFTPGDMWKREGNAAYEKFLNSNGRGRLRCKNCGFLTQGP